MDTQYSGGDARVLLALVRRLGDAIEASIAGDGPTQAELDAAPLLVDWDNVADVCPVLRGTLAGGQAVEVTREIFLFAPQAGWARTLTRLYRLGASANDMSEAH